MYGKQIVLNIVEVTKDGHTCPDGDMLFNPASYNYMTKHRDENGNEFTCIHFKEGGVQFVSNHPLEIKRMIEGTRPTNADQFEDMKTLPDWPAPPEPLKKPAKKAEFPDAEDEAPMFKTQVVKRPRGRPRKS